MARSCFTLNASCHDQKKVIERRYSLYACEARACALSIIWNWNGKIDVLSHAASYVTVGGAAQTPRARAAIHGWGAPKTEQGVSYDWARSFVAILDTQPVPENSLRGRQIKRSSCRKRPNVEAAGTATSRRQHLQVRREVRPEEVRCLRPTPAVHFRPLPAAVCAVCPLSALLTHCIAVVWQ